MSAFAASFAKKAAMAGNSGQLKRAFYGDDFTGSTDALELLAFAGMRVALFIVPGAPLCRLVSDCAGLDGLEVALKGGQMGAPDFFAFIGVSGDGIGRWYDSAVTCNDSTGPFDGERPLPDRK